MSDWSIRLNRSAISALILLVMFLANFIIGAIRPSQTITEPEKVFQHQIVQQEIYGHLSRLKDCQDANYRQAGSAATPASGWDTVYLADKYIDLNYFIGVQPTTISMIAAAALSDSSFVVLLYDAAGAGHVSSYNWETVGDIR